MNTWFSIIAGMILTICVCGHPRQGHGTIYMDPDKRTGACLHQDVNRKRDCSCLMFHQATTNDIGRQGRREGTRG